MYRFHLTHLLQLLLHHLKSRAYYSHYNLTHLIVAETRMERIEHYMKRGAATAEMGLEKKALEKIIVGLNENKLIRSVDLSPDETRQVRGFQFLTLKPLMVILNSDEDCFGKTATRRWVVSHGAVVGHADQEGILGNAQLLELRHEFADEWIDVTLQSILEQTARSRDLLLRRHERCHHRPVSDVERFVCF